MNDKVMFYDTNQSSPDKILGQVLHQVLKEYITYENEDILGNFTDRFEKYKNWKLAYQIGDDWESMHSIGLRLLQGFVNSYEGQGITAYLSENKMLYMHENGNISVKQPDIIGLKDGKAIVVDFKFGREWTQEDVDAHEQFTEYAMVVEQSLNEKPPIMIAVCNLIKKTREVKWLYSQRTKQFIEDYKHRKNVLACQEFVF